MANIGAEAMEAIEARVITSLNHINQAHVVLVDPVIHQKIQGIWQKMLSLS